MNKHILPLGFIAVLGSIFLENLDLTIVLTAIVSTIAVYQLTHRKTL